MEIEDALRIERIAIIVYPILTMSEHRVYRLNRDKAGVCISSYGRKCSGLEIQTNVQVRFLMSELLGDRGSKKCSKSGIYRSIQDGSLNLIVDIWENVPDSEREYPGHSPTFDLLESATVDLLESKGREEML